MRGWAGWGVARLEEIEGEALVCTPPVKRGGLGDAGGGERNARAGERGREGTCSRNTRNQGIKECVASVIHTRI